MVGLKHSGYSYSEQPRAVIFQGSTGLAKENWQEVGLVGQSVDGKYQKGMLLWEDARDSLLGTIL